MRIADRSLAEDRWASDGRTGISMMAYYTPEFEQEFGGRSEAEREIKKYIEETNKAYRDSDIQVQLHAFCFEKMDISDNENDVANKRLDDFTWKKGSIHKLLNSFDIAVLLTKNGVSTLYCLKSTSKFIFITSLIFPYRLENSVGIQHVQRTLKLLVWLGLVAVQRMGTALPLHQILGLRREAHSPLHTRFRTSWVHCTTGKHDNFQCWYFPRFILNCLYCDPVIRRRAPK